MNISRRAGRAAYKTLINAIPDVAVDVLDRPLSNAKGRRADAKFSKEASLWKPGVPSKWYATDGSNCFYYFRRTKVEFETRGYMGFGRLAVTIHGVTSTQAYYRHGGQLTDRRPAGWQSVATINAINLWDGHGSLQACGWESNEDLDLDIRAVDRARAEFKPVMLRGSFHQFAEQVQRVMERV